MGLSGREAALTATLARLRRLARLDLTVFDDVRYDDSATPWSLGVAAGSLALFGLGGWLWWIISGFGDGDAVFLKTVVLGTLLSLLAWLIWLLVVYGVLQRFGGVTAPVAELVRTAGFAATPAAVGLLMAVPAVSFGVGLLAIGGWLLATQAAIERTTGARGGVVMVANLAGFAAWVVLMSLLTTATNQFGPGPFAAESIWDALSGLEAGQAVLGR